MTADEYVPSDEDARGCFLDGAAGSFVAEDWEAFLARVRRDAAREALDGLAEHIDWTASQFLGVRVGSQKAQDVRDYRDTHYPEETP